MGVTTAVSARGPLARTIERCIHRATTENIGNTYLLKDSIGRGFTQSANGGQTFNITLNGQHIGDKTWDGWTLRGAEIINGTNSVANINADGRLAYWNLNSNWAYTGSSIHQPGSSGYYQAEVDFKQDFNADGSIGAPASQLDYTEQIGNTWLAKEPSMILLG